MRKIAAMLCAGLLTALCLCGCRKQEPEKMLPRSSKTIIRDMVSAYGQNPEQASTYLTELNENDSAAGACWNEIMEHWGYINSEMPINTKKLPDDLPKDDSLCILVLGYQLNADGSMSKELIGRLKTALACAKQYPEAFVLCTGGGTASRNPAATEAGRMGQWLLKKGLEEKRLIIEDQSLTTAQNAMFSYDILQKNYPQVNTAAIVTSEYHIPWGTLMFDTVFRLNAPIDGAPAIKTAANCAYEIKREGFDDAASLRCETSGMMELVQTIVFAE